MGLGRDVKPSSLDWGRRNVSIHNQSKENFKLSAQNLLHFVLSKISNENLYFAWYEHVRQLRYCTGPPASAHGLCSSTAHLGGKASPIPFLFLLSVAAAAASSYSPFPAVFFALIRSLCVIAFSSCAGRESTCSCFVRASSNGLLLLRLPYSQPLVLTWAAQKRERKKERHWEREIKRERDWERERERERDETSAVVPFLFKSFGGVI
jgi:hypothetical protein